MKKTVSAVLSISLCSLFVVGCNNGENKDAVTPNATIATDTATMAVSPSDSAAMNNSTTTMTADSMSTTRVVPNPAKKGKKGMVTIAMNDKKTGEDMDAMDKEGYYTNVYPSYPGGDKALESFFEKNIQYPSNASDNGVEGTVTISFTVDEKGNISSPKTSNPTIGYGLEEEALRVFKKMPSWKPGSLKGRNVKTRFNLPVRFQLEG